MADEIITFCLGKEQQKHTLIPKNLVEYMDLATRDHFFNSRSEFIRFAIRFYIDYLDGKIIVK